MSEQNKSKQKQLDVLPMLIKYLILHNALGMNDIFDTQHAFKSTLSLSLSLHESLVITL